MRSIALLAITVALAIVAAVMLSMLGADWLNEDIGHGLHPGISFPGATLCAVYAVWGFWKILDFDANEYIEEPDLMVRHY